MTAARPRVTKGGAIGRNSTGPRPATRALDLSEVLARQAHWHGQPPSAARTAALTTIRRQLLSIRNRVENLQ